MPDPRHTVPSSASSAHRPAATAPPAQDFVDLEALELIDEDPAPGIGSSGTQGSSASAPAPKKITFGPEVTQRQENWKRKPNANGSGSVRVRSFHGKLSEQGLEYMDHYINEWLDQHPEVEVKFVTSSVGQFDGKMKEPAVILQVWY